MTTNTAMFERVYIWERPVRLYHWATAASVGVLTVTGLIMAHPPALLTTADASATQWFGLTRLVHFIAGFVLTFAFVVRLYWFFAGNEYSRWRNFVPLPPSRFMQQLRQVIAVVKIDLLQIDKGPLHVRGHNALAAWTYTAIFALTIFEIATGFALYAPMSGWWFAQLFAWITPLMGGDAAVRLGHYVGMWAFVVFTIIHVYLSVYHDSVEGTGEISSMVSGAKFFPAEKS